MKQILWALFLRHAAVLQERCRKVGLDTQDISDKQVLIIYHTIMGTENINDWNH